MKNANALIPLILLSFLLNFVDSTKNYTELVYKKCSRGAFLDDLASDSHAQSLNSMFSDMVSHSLQTKFYTTTTGDSNGGISGFFQCKTELSNEDCNFCITKLQNMSNTLCNRAVAAKIQLSGCHVKYGTGQFSPANHRTLGLRENYDEEHKVCSGERAEEKKGFEEKRDAAFEEVEQRAAEREGDRSRTVEYEGFRVEAVCEEDMEVCACAECVGHAAEIAKEECQWSVSGRVFLTQCSLSYEYEEYEGGGGGGFGEGDGYGRGEGYHGDRLGNAFGGQNTGRTIAIIMGGAAAAFVIGLLFILICRGGKRDDY